MSKSLFVGKAGAYLGVPILVNDLLAGVKRPKKLHRRRKNQTLSYHQRIQKKWTKRYGYTTVEHAYVMQGSSTRQTIVVSRRTFELMQQQGVV